MATAKATITVGGKKVDPYHVTLQQRCDWHHHFEIVVSSEKVETSNSINIDKSIEYVGKTAEISISSAGNELKFDGIITSVNLDRTYTGDSVIVFSGYSPTYLMEDGLGVKSYEKKDIKGIVNEIMGQYPSNMLNPIVSPKYSSTIPYIVRYKETEYQFLSRLATVYGEWFYYNGKSVVFGELPNPESIDLTLGKDLNSFNYGVNLRPSKFKYQFYNYEENRTLEQESKSFKPGWLDTYGKKALDAADSLFPVEPLNSTWQNAGEDALIKHLVETRKSSILSDSAYFKGSAQHAGIMVGGRIGVNVINKVGGLNVKAFVGRYRITGVTHQLNANKDYSNDFTAVPIAVTAPPVNKNIFKPEAESQVAVVKDNNDPDKLGRIRVQFKWQSDDEMTPWIRQITNYANKDRGTYFVPEIDDEVYIDFEQGNPDRPYMQGALYHGKTAPEFFDPDNNFKTIKTRSGHTIKFDDTDGSEMITILDKNDNQIILNTSEESITISAPKKILIESEEIELKGKNITISASSELKEKGNNVTIGAKKNLKLSGDMAAELVSNQTVDVSGKTSVKVASDVNTEVGGNATLKLKSSGMASLQGALVKIN